MRSLLLILVLCASNALAQVDSLWYDNGISQGLGGYFHQGTYFDLSDFGLSSFELTEMHLTVCDPTQPCYVHFEIYPGDSLAPDMTTVLAEYQVAVYPGGPSSEEVIWTLEEPLMVPSIFWVIQDEGVTYYAGLRKDSDGNTGHSMQLGYSGWEPALSDFFIRCFSGDAALTPSTWGSIKTAW
jgi:hypothetical protein